MANISEVYTNYSAAKAALEESIRQLVASRKELQQAILDLVDPDSTQQQPHTPIAFLVRSLNDLSEGQIVTVHSRVPNDVLPQDQGDQVKALIISSGWDIITDSSRRGQWSFVIRQKTK